MSYSIGFDIFAKDRASDTFDKLGKKVGDTESKFTKHSAAFKVGAAAAGVAIVAFATDSVAAYTEAEKSQRVLTDAYARFPAMADVSIESLQELAAAQQKKTKFDGDEVAAAIGTLGQYKLTGAQLKELTPLMLDYAEKSGKTLPDAAKALGLATMGNAKALKEVGINIPKTAAATVTLTKAQDGAAKAVKNVKEAQQALSDLQSMQRGKDKLTMGDHIAMRKAKEKLKDAIGEQTDALDFVSVAQKNAAKTGGKFSEIVGGLRKQVGGFAEKEGLSAEGRAAILKNKFGDLQETVGSKLQPALISMTDAGTKVVDWMTENEDTVKVLGTAIGVLVVGIGTIVGITKVYTAVQTALNVVMAMNPIGLVVAAIALLAAGLVYAYKNSETFRKVVDTAFKAIGDAGKWLWNNALQPMIQMILVGFANVSRSIGNVLIQLGNIPGFEWARTAGQKMLGAADGAERLALGVKKIPPDKVVNVRVRRLGASDAQLSGLEGQISRLKSKTINLTVAQQGGRNKLAGMLEGRAGGGPTSAGRAYIVGEEGPEFWSETSNGFVTNAADTARALAGGRAGTALGGQSVNIYISGALDPDAVGRQIQQVLLRLKRTGGAQLGLA